MPVRKKHLAMPDRFKKAASSVQAYRDYYWSKRKKMVMVWPAGRTPAWWEAKKSPKKRKEMEQALKKKKKLAAERLMCSKKRKLGTAPSLNAPTQEPHNEPIAQAINKEPSSSHAESMTT